MVDEPETGGRGDSAEIKEPSAPAVIVVPQGDTQKAQGQGQTDNSGKTRKYTRYIVWPIVALWRLVRWLFVLADGHDGVITALATIAIVVLTYFYVSYSKDQWTTMNQQLDLARREARLTHCCPYLDRRDIGAKYDDKTKEMWGTFTAINIGEQDAENIEVALRIDVLASPPTPERRKFEDRDFKSTIPARLGKKVEKVDRDGKPSIPLRP
jgi:hypothetical protein